MTLDKLTKDWNMQMWLGQQCYKEGKYVIAEQKFRKALKDLENALITDERLAMTLNNLALTCCAQGKHKEADPLYQQALGIDQSGSKKNKMLLAEDFNNIATHYRLQGMLDKAEQLYKKALQLFEEADGDSAAGLANCLNNIGVLYCEQERGEDAIKYLKQALAIKGSLYGSKSREYAETLINLASTYCRLNRCEEADPLFDDSVRILEYTVDPAHKELFEAFEAYLHHLKKVGRIEKAKEVEADIKRIRKTHNMT